MASLFSEKPYVPTWSPPVKVNPLIRLSRWAGLVCGLYYGYSKLRMLSEVAKCQREDFMSRQVGHSNVGLQHGMMLSLMSLSVLFITLESRSRAI